MAGWEQELAELLRELGVTLEGAAADSPTHLQAKQRASYSDARQDEEESKTLPVPPWGDDAPPPADEDAWLTELRLMRREVDSIVAQVIRLMQSGDLDASLKEDVMVVLRALRRRASPGPHAAPSDETYLEFAAAMLHFCRLVLRLSETAIED
ncbi:hypothetical protein [Thermogemmatispora tikiterensis]|uniref:Uncharacterized protein n=1 Tax=Thermogemmatispora tikiterensis TaxID=1825093 RepID=A0A328VKE6_9CHLR|nr:hypothetical protein [Thermogemmatispora tikiterensis]RAQ97391.1 hypothetical protein A4R35_17775 [Thermogemmatispora tikiterensis]